MRKYPANIYLFNNRNTRKGCEICSKLTIKTPEQRHQDRVLNMFKVNESTSDVNDFVLMFLIVNLNIFHTFF